jgi:hypothetical protein
LKRKSFLLSILLASMLIMTSCVSTKFINSWRDSSYRGPVKKIFVVGVDKDRGRRSLIENEFVRQFKARGTEAFASAELLSGDEVPADIVWSKVLEQGADAVLVIKFIGKETKETHIPKGDPDVSLEFNAENKSIFQIQTEEEQEISYVHNIAIMQLTLYKTDTEKAIWSSRTKTEYEGGRVDHIKPFASFVVSKLAGENLIN